MRSGSAIEIVPTGGSLGADIVGLDLGQELSQSTFEDLLKAWSKHLVLRFRQQELEEDDLIRFSARFGELDAAPTKPVDVPHHPTRKEINLLSNIVVDGKPIGALGNSELVWHQDMTYKDLPPKASILYGLETPATGGDTYFYNLQLAYDTLPLDLAARIRILSCKHDATRNSAGQLRAGFASSYSNENRPGAVHPLVIRHPTTGKKSLYLGRRPGAWIVGFSDRESDDLLDELWAHIENGPHFWTQEWQPKDVVLWDNRFTLHRRGTLDPAQRRLMYRTQIRDEQGPAPIH
ncbi:MAG: TauD/TfdA dioxygenase family protein [Hyphomicrobiaceae bacterium]